MSTMISLASLVLLAVAVSGFQLNVIETARRLGLYSYLTALEETNSADLVADTDAITVFIPSNEAFKNVNSETKNMWRNNPAYYQKLMRSHVVKGRFDYKDLIDEHPYLTYANLTGRFVNYKAYSVDVQVFTGAVIDTKNFNIEASNGVIHVIEQVVGSLEDTDLLGKAVNNSDLSKVVEGVVAAKLEGVLNGDVIPGIGEVLNILHFPEDADMDLGEFLMPNQPDSNSKMDLDILYEFLHPSDLPTVFRIGLVKFEAHSQDKVIVTSLRRSKQAVWSIHELLQVLSYLLSEECLDDMEIMPKMKKKKGRDSHPRSSFTHVFDGNLRSKWVVLNKRPYLQIDRYNAEDRDGYPTHRSRINQEAIRCLKVADVTYIINQLVKAQRYGMPDLPVEDYEYPLLYQIAGKLQDYETNNYVEAIRELGKDKKAMQELISALFFLLSVYCASRSIANACSIKSMLGLEKLQHIFQTM